MNILQKGKYRVGVYDNNRQRLFILSYVTRLIDVERFLTRHNVKAAVLLVYDRKTNLLQSVLKYSYEYKKIIV